MRIAVEGCAHGELDSIFEAVEHAERFEGVPIDLVLCCGDFQAVRNEQDLETMQCPLKYRSMNTFYKYYSGEKAVPRPVVFIGGNHEASSHLQELPLGGWAAPGVYFLGNSGVVKFRGVRIGGMSGIFKSHDFWKPRRERPPFYGGSMSAVYHQRWQETAMLLALRSDRSDGPAGAEAGSAKDAAAALRPGLDVCASHDWPISAVSRGHWRSLKRHFQSDIHRGQLGSPAASLVLRSLRPAFWFSAHLHCKYAALLRHPMQPPPADVLAGAGELAAEEAAEAARVASQGRGGDSGGDGEGPAAEAPAVTRFLALDKPIPGRSFLHVVEVPIPDHVGDEEASLASLCFDPEWCAVLRKAFGKAAAAAARPAVPQGTLALSGERLAPSREDVGAAEAALRAAFGAGDWSGGAGAAPASEGSSVAGPVAIPPQCPQTVPAFRCPEGFDPSSSTGSSCAGGHGDGNPARRGRMATQWGYPGPRMPQPAPRGSPQTDALALALELDHAAFNGVPFAGPLAPEEYERIRAEAARGRQGGGPGGGGGAAPWGGRAPGGGGGHAGGVGFAGGPSPGSFGASGGAMGGFGGMGGGALGGFGAPGGGHTAAAAQGPLPHVPAAQLAAMIRQGGLVPPAVLMQRAREAMAATQAQAQAQAQAQGSQRGLAAVGIGSGEVSADPDELDIDGRAGANKARPSLAASLPPPGRPSLAASLPPPGRPSLAASLPPPGRPSLAASLPPPKPAGVAAAEASADDNELSLD